MTGAVGIWAVVVQMLLLTVFVTAAGAGIVDAIDRNTAACSAEDGERVKP